MPRFMILDKTLVERVNPMNIVKNAVGQDLLGKKSKPFLLVGLVALLILVPTMLEFGIILPRSRYILLLLCIMCIYTVATSGLDILFGYTGQISLGHAGFYAIGAYMSVLMSHKTFGFSAWFGFTLPPILTIFLASLIAMVFGILLALPAAKLVYHFLSLLTIAFGQLIYLALSSFPEVTNSFLGITSIPPISLFGFAFDSYYSFYLLALFLTVLLLVTKTNIIQSRVGRSFIAIRENHLAANGCGINVQYYKIMSFAISAFFTGLAGALYAHLIGFISPESFMYAQSIIFLTMLIFGGNGNLAGPIMGAVVITVIQEALQSARNYQMLIYGFFLLITILFLPKGIYGIIQLVRKLHRKAAVKQHANT